MAYLVPTAHCAVGTKTLMLQARFAHPPMPHRNVFSKHFGVTVGLFSEKALQLFLQNARPPGSLRSPYGCLRTETAFQAVPVFRMAYSLQTAHCAVCRETRMLQVRCANPTGNFAPKRPFGTFRCYAWLFFRKEHTMLFSPKRTCFRFAALTLRVQGAEGQPLRRCGG